MAIMFSLCSIFHPDVFLPKYSDDLFTNRNRVKRMLQTNHDAVTKVRENSKILFRKFRQKQTFQFVLYISIAGIHVRESVRFYTI